MADPRDIERITPETPATNTNVNTPPLEDEGDAQAPRIQGAIVNQETVEPSEKQVFPGKGQGENKKTAGKDAA